MDKVEPVQLHEFFGNGGISLFIERKRAEPRALCVLALPFGLCKGFGDDNAGRAIVGDECSDVWVEDDAFILFFRLRGLKGAAFGRVRAGRERIEFIIIGEHVYRTVHFYEAAQIHTVLTIRAQKERIARRGKGRQGQRRKRQRHEQ